MSEDKEPSQSTLGCSMAIVLCIILFACGCGAWYYVGQQELSGEKIWTIDAPAGWSHGLFTDDCLTDESCPDCVIGDLAASTQLKPAWKGCQTAAWDAGYRFCHVRVLSGDYEGEYGWVNEDFIDK